MKKWKEDFEKKWMEKSFPGIDKDKKNKTTK